MLRSMGILYDCVGLYGSAVPTCSMPTAWEPCPGNTNAIGVAATTLWAFNP